MRIVDVGAFLLPVRFSLPGLMDGTRDRVATVCTLAGAFGYKHLEAVGQRLRRRRDVPIPLAENSR